VPLAEVAIKPVQVAPIQKRVNQQKKRQLKNQLAAVAEAKTDSAVSTKKISAGLSLKMLEWHQGPVF